eukprot:357436-Chlamydomonas_euryale.AAC.1
MRHGLPAARWACWLPAGEAKPTPPAWQLRGGARRAGAGAGDDAFGARATKEGEEGRRSRPRWGSRVRPGQ